MCLESDYYPKAFVEKLGITGAAITQATGGNNTTSSDVVQVDSKLLRLFCFYTLKQRTQTSKQASKQGTYNKQANKQASKHSTGKQASNKQPSKQASKQSKQAGKQ